MDFLKSNPLNLRTLLDGVRTLFSLLRKVRFLGFIPLVFRTDVSQGVHLGNVKNKLSYRRSECLSEPQLNHHVHVVGASGFGKSVLLSHIIKDSVRSGKGLLYIDLKNDQAAIQKLKTYIKDCGREKDFKFFTLSSADASSNYNILQSGTPTQLRDTLMVSLRWSEEYYRNRAASYLLKVLIGLCHLRDIKNEPLDLHILLKSVCETDFLRKQIAKVSNDFLKEKTMLEQCYLFLKDSGNYNSLQGLRTQLESLVLSDFGDKLRANGLSGIELFEAINNSQIIFLILDSRRYCESSQVIGRLILQKLKAASAQVDAEIPNDVKKPFRRGD